MQNSNKKSVLLKPHKIESLERRHPWVFSGAIQAVGHGQSLEEGEIVDVLNEKGAFVARGYYESGSIAVRIMTFDEKEEINDDYWLRRMYQAYRMRVALGLVGKGLAYRLIHGEGDDIPGLIIDVYDGVAVMQAHTIGIHQRRTQIARSVVTATAGMVSTVYYKSESTLANTQVNRSELDGVLLGSLIEEPVITEHGLKFIPDIRHGQKTGFFLDQRDNRKTIQDYAHGRVVLNMFCYTGGFSLHALSGGATRVVSVDSSPKAMSITKKNVEQNFHNAEGILHETVVGDAFQYLDNMKEGEFDFIILDPPAFAKRREVTHNALQGYRRINSTAMKKIAQGGILATFSCSQVVSVLQFRQSIFTAALMAGRRVRVLRQFTQAADHPVSIYHPEGEYLKGLLLYVE